jgi:hypothetical protein
MFELAVLRRTGSGEDVVDIGLLAETLLFYQRVHLVLEGGTVAYLIKTIGPDLLLELLDLPCVSASYLRESLATVTHSQNGLSSHNFAQITFDPPAKSGKTKHVSDDKWITLQLERQLGPSRATTQYANKLTKKLRHVNYKDHSPGSKDLPALTRQDLQNAEFVEQAVRGVLAALVPSFVLPSGWHFRPMVMGEQIIIDTNFDFERINQEYHKSVPPSHSTLAPSYLINHLLEARGGNIHGSEVPWRTCD